MAVVAIIRATLRPLLGGRRLARSSSSRPEQCRRRRLEPRRLSRERGPRHKKTGGLLLSSASLERATRQRRATLNATNSKPDWESRNCSSKSDSEPLAPEARARPTAPFGGPKMVWRPHRAVSQWGFGVTARFWDSGRFPRMSRGIGASEVSWDFEVTAGSVAAPFWGPPRGARRPRARRQAATAGARPRRQAATEEGGKRRKEEEGGGKEEGGVF